MMNERSLTGEQGADGLRTEAQASDIGSDSKEDSNEDSYLLFANSCRSYFQFQMKSDSAK